MEQTGQTYAVLISGGLADRDGYDEFWNDLVLMREALLINLYGIQANAENIYVLYGDTGKDFYHSTRSKYNYTSRTSSPKSSKSNLTDFPATYDKVEYVFSGLACGNAQIPKINANDTLFVWTFGHGFRNGNNSWLFLADGSRLYDHDFAALVSNISCEKRIICMQQCFSGGFIRYLSDPANAGSSRNIVLTACYETEFASRSPRSDDVDHLNNIYHHGEFNFYLYQALQGHTLSGENAEACTAGNEFVPKKAYKYINDRHETEENPQYWDYHGRVGETPRGDYLKASWNLGDGEDGIRVELSYRIPDIYKSEEQKEIMLSINGVQRHIFRIDSPEYRINTLTSGPETAHSRFILDGVFTADYYHRLVYFEGNIKIRGQILYCPAQDNYSSGFTPIYPVMDSNKGLTCKTVIFNWI